MSHYKTFLQLHQQWSPFVLGNIWDVSSARIFETNGYKAIGTSSHAVAHAWGYEDGEKIAFGKLLQLAERITQVVDIPFTVDMEAGFSESTKGIIENIEKLHDAGVAGINLEDTVPNPERSLREAEAFAKTLSAIAAHISRKNLEIFINVRTDGFLLGMPSALGETLSRIKLYERSGANGIFVPCITDKNDIAEVVKATRLPVNVMCMPHLPSFEELQALGVKRISMGPFLYNKATEAVSRLSKAVMADNGFAPILG